MTHRRIVFCAVVLVFTCLFLGALGVSYLRHKDISSVVSAENTDDVSVSASPQSNITSPVRHERETPKGRLVAGKVRNTGGTAVPNALVEILSGQSTECIQIQASTPTREPLARAVSRADGIFRIETSIKPGTYCFRVSAKGYAQIEKVEPIPAEDIENMEFILDTGVLVGGRLIDLDGVPIPNAIIFVNTSGGDYLEAETTNAGTFRLPLVKPGRIEFWVRFSPRPVWNTSSANVPGHPLLTLDIEAAKEYRNVEVIVKWRMRNRDIDGVVVNTDNRPVQGARVWATRTCDSRPLLHKGDEAERLTNANGEFRIAQVSTSSGAVIPDEILEDALDFEPVFLHCEHPDYEPTHMEKVLVGISGVTIMLEPRDRGTIIGRVLDRTTRQPVSDACVYPWSSIEKDGLVFHDKDEFINHARSGEGQVDQNGEFSCENVRSGKVTLVAYSPTRGILFQPGILVHRNGVTEVEVFFDAPGTLEVRLTDNIVSAEQVVRSVHVSPEGMDSTSFPPFPSTALATLMKGEARKDVSGNYTVTLAAGRYRVLTKIWRPYPLAGPGAYFWQESVEIRPGETTSIEPTSPATGTIRLQLPIDESSENAEILVVPDGDPSFLASLDVPIVTTDHGPLFDQYPYVLCLMYGKPVIVAGFIPAGRVAVLININRRMTDEWRQLGVKVVDIIPDQENLVVFEGGAVSGEHAGS